MKLNHIASAIACSLLFSACSLIPEYHKPEAPVSQTWPQGDAYTHAGLANATPGQQSAPDVGWKDFFKDPGLRRVIGLALENNRDLQKAALNVDAYRAIHRIQDSTLLPHFGVGASADMERLPADVSIPGVDGRQDVYSVNLGMASYEVDFFGKLRSLSKEALENYLATEQGERSARIALVSAVATAYVTWRTDQDLSKLTDDTLAADERSLAIVTRNAAAGITSQLAIRQASVSVDHERALQAADTRQVALDVNALQLLVGAPVPTDLANPGPVDGVVMFNLPVGLSSDVLLRRPDIEAAEHRLKAANADIGAARAAFFPSISLTASAGTTGGAVTELFSATHGFWKLGPQINLPIFTAGELKASLDYSKIQKQITVVDYQKAIQTAFREVADGLATRSTYVDQMQSQVALVANDQEYLRLAQERFHEGITTFLVVLDAQRELLGAQQQLLRDRMAQSTAEVSLYAALGGGLKADSTPLAPATASTAKATSTPVVASVPSATSLMAPRSTSTRQTD